MLAVFYLYQFKANMPEEVTQNAVEDSISEERSSLINTESLPLSRKNDDPSANNHDVEEPADVHDEETEKNVALLLGHQLNGKGFFEGFAYIWGLWTSRPYIGVNGYGWMFKLVLWCLR